jgi:TonB-dependent receptor-like protein
VDGFSLTALGYHAIWNSTDQVPQRAIETGTIGRFGSVDGTDGGDTYRYSASGEWQRTRRNATLKLAGYAIATNLNLFSNFTYFLDDPVHGDQIHQHDRRLVSGGRISYRRIDRWRNRELQNTVGVQVRNDAIGDVSLAHTQARQLLQTIRADHVSETSVAAYVQNETVWNPWLRTVAGFRADGYWYQVDAANAADGGSGRAGHPSPKGGVVVGPFRATEFYVNAGLGYHSNDVRAATLRHDPITGEAVAPVSPLVSARGLEEGIRTVAVRHLQSSFTVWSLSLDSELLFVGDVGTVEPSRPSHRCGIEWANYYAARPWLTIDADVSWSHARFTDPDPAGDHIPGAVETVASAGAAVDDVRGVFLGARWRYFGPRPLVEDGSVRSKATSLLNMEGGYKMGKRTRLVVDVFNVLNALDSDIDYFYASRLPGELAAGVEDIHLHPTLPRTARIWLLLAF